MFRILTPQIHKAVAHLDHNYIHNKPRRHDANSVFSGGTASDNKVGIVTTPNFQCSWGNRGTQPYFILINSMRITLPSSL